MWYKIKKGIFPTLITISALSVSVSAAFYSITGLSKLFAGAQTEVIIMASSLELAKLVIASLLYRYWSTINKILRTYLSIACVVLVLITSMGIYGFLSAAYQEVYSELAINENQKQFLNKKIDFYEKDVARYDKELENTISNINNLSTAKSRSIQVKDTTSQTGYRNTISTSELRLAQKRIAVEEQNKKQVQSLRQKATDSLQKYKLEVLKLENNSDQAGELGPLKYLAGITGYPMDKIINILLLVIIFVFDPLAISLVIAANFAFSKSFNLDNNPSENKDDDPEDLTEDFEDWDTTLNDGLEEEEWEEEKNPLQDFLDQEGDPKIKKKYEDLPIKDYSNKVNKSNQTEQIKYQIKKLNSRLATGLSAFRSRKINEEIRRLKSQLSDEEDTTKIY